MEFRWWADDGQFIAVFGSYIPSSTKKKVIKFGPPLTNFLDLRMMRLGSIGMDYLKVSCVIKGQFYK